VLLIDDHLDSVEMYAMYLRVEGFHPLSASNADEGFARACVCHPDVIVADLWLPDGSGLELTRRLRADRRTTDVGIIMLTADAGGPVQEQAIAAGCDRFLVKPCVPDALALEIRKVLHDRQTAVAPKAVRLVPSPPNTRIHEATTDGEHGAEPPETTAGTSSA